MKKRHKKLTLNRETLIDLQTVSLQVVVGGKSGDPRGSEIMLGCNPCEKPPP